MMQMVHMHANMQLTLSDIQRVNDIQRDSWIFPLEIRAVYGVLT